MSRFHIAIRAARIGSICRELRRIRPLTTEGWVSAKVIKNHRRLAPESASGFVPAPNLWSPDPQTDLRMLGFRRVDV